MKTVEERAQIFLDALHLYNPELKYSNDKINKDAIVKLIEDQDKITRHACDESVAVECVGVSSHPIVKQCISAIMNTKTV